MQAPELLQKPVQPQENLPEKKRKFWPIFIGVFFLVSVVCILVAFIVTKQTRILPLAQVSNIQTILNPSPTPFEFQELTIPYLRNRMYQSRLSSLEPVSSNAHYESFLTSYDSDGYAINALLTKPTGEAPQGGWPAIIFIHGYIPPSQYQTLTQYADYVDYLARNGFVVLKIDLRGHGTSEGQAGGGYFGSDYIVDTLSAYSALQASDFVNPKKIGLWGHSMAGNIVLRSLASKPEIPAAVVWAGAVYSYEDREKYGINDSSYQPPNNPTGQNRRRRLTDLYGEASSGNAFWKVMAPTNYLSDLKGALQINHATDDPVVDIGYSRDLMKLLDKTEVPHELQEYPSGGHNITGASFVSAMQNTVSFLNKYFDKTE